MKNLMNVLSYVMQFFAPKTEKKAVRGPLKMNLQFFSEPTDPQDPPNDPQDPPADPPKQDPKKDHMIPKSRFDEVNSKYKTMQEELDQLKAEKEERERLEQEQQGKFQSLYEQSSKDLDTYKSKADQEAARAKSLESVITNLLDTKLQSVPEEMHDLIPENLTAEQKLDWVNRAEAKGLFKKEQQAPLGGPTNPKGGGKANLDGMNPFQLLQSGYGSKQKY